MLHLITLERAYREFERLKNYISLVENYETDTLDKWIIKEYAITNSIAEVVKRANRNGVELNKEYATSIINSKPRDNLHKILRSGYRRRLKPNKRTK